MTDSLRAETVQITGHDGDEIEAYLAQPLDEGHFGAVVVIHHMPGYDEGTKEITRRFAAHGYLALCPNLYSRETEAGASPDDAAAVARAKGGVPDERLVGDVKGAIGYLKGLAGSSSTPPSTVMAPSSPGRRRKAIRSRSDRSSISRRISPARCSACSASRTNTPLLARSSSWRRP